MKTSRFNIASVSFVTALVILSVLVVILLRNPATHANLEDPDFYERTEIAALDSEYLYTGYGNWEGVVEAGGDSIETGRILYVRAGCVGCHGIFGEGATVAGDLWEIEGEDVADFHFDLRDGPSGMPPYPETVLTREEAELILAYLGAAPTEAEALGVDTTTTTRAPVVVTTTTAPATDTTAGTGDTTTTTAGPVNRVLEAPRVEGLTVDGDPTDWEGVPELRMTLKPIIGEGAPEQEAAVRVAHDGEFVYVLFTVDDDYNWSDLDPRFSGAPSVMWPLEPAAGPHMGGEDPSGLPSLGLVDLWYWRLECGIGVEQGGAVDTVGGGDPGNDGTCNLDDEYATEPEVVEDDDDPASENSLLGVFGHSNPVEDGEGTWYFEFRRPLQTGDPYDTQFAPGMTARLALAYWDPDAGGGGWGGDDHVQSSDEGWIDVIFAD